MRQTALTLSNDDRIRVKEIIKKGEHNSRVVVRAQILSGLDRGVKESDLINVLLTSRGTVWSTRKSYNEGGLGKALYDEKRSGKPVRFGDDVTSQIVALACSDPPKGLKRWSIRSLTAEVKETLKLDSISRETIRRALKKTL
jgi:hypothetical protein